MRGLRVISVERCGPPAADPAVVTAAGMVAGHVGLDVSCLDRLYLNGYVNKLQTPGGVVYFFHDHRCSSAFGSLTSGFALALAEI